MRIPLLTWTALALLAAAAAGSDTPPPAAPAYTLGSPRLATLKATTIVSRTVHIRPGDIDTETRAIADIKDKLSAAHVSTIGGPIFIFHQLPASATEPLDVEIGMPVSDSVKAPDGCQVRTLAATPAVMAVYQGPLTTIGQGAGALFSQMGAFGQVPTGEFCSRSLYYEDAESPNDLILLEIPSAAEPAHGAQ